MINNELKFSVFDFDGTLYRGSSAVDFWLFMVKKKFWIIIVLPWQILAAILNLVKIISREKFKEQILVFTKFFPVPEIEKYVQEFWNQNTKMIPEVKEYLKHDKESGLITIINSACYTFILQDIADKLGVKLLATEYDLNKHQLIGRNCSKDNKVIILQEWVKKEYNTDIFTVQKFYSDSSADRPLYNIAQEKFYVHHGKLTKGEPA